MLDGRLISEEIDYILLWRAEFAKFTKSFGTHPTSRLMTLTSEKYRSL